MKRQAIQAVKNGVKLSLPVALLLVMSCSTVNTLLKEGVQKPQVQVQKVNISGLSFQAIDLLFDINIQNPNSLGIKLNSFDYDLSINDNSFVKGINDEGLEIAANGVRTVQLPLTLQFADLYRTASSLANQDSSTYVFKSGFAFDVPVLGSVRVPVSKTGGVPLLKLPSISVGSLQVKSLNLGGADLELTLNLKNPNGFAVNLQKLVYDFNVNGRSWGSGQSDRDMKVDENGEGTLIIPLSLNFREMGRSVFELLSGNQELSYQLDGNFDIGTSLPLLPGTTLSFDKDGKVDLKR